MNFHKCGLFLLHPHVTLLKGKQTQTTISRTLKEASGLKQGGQKVESDRKAFLGSKNTNTLQLTGFPSRRGSSSQFILR